MTKIIRTAMADAFHDLVYKQKHPAKLDGVGRMVCRQVLTLEAKGVGVKFRPKDQKKQAPAETAVVKEPINNVGVAA